MSLDHIQEELDEIYNFDYKFSVMKLFTINDKGAMFARSICGIGEALKGFIFQFRHENEINAKLTEDNDKLKKEIKELKEEKDAWGESEKYYNLFLDEYEKITNTTRPHRAVRNVIEAFKENEKMKKQITELTNGCNLKERIIELEENNHTLKETIDDNKRIEEGNKKLAKFTCNKLKTENEKLKEEIKENEGYEQMKKISNVKTDLINELFSKMVQEADIDDGISISKEYGNKYIDEWNKIYEDIIKDTIKVMNECELDDDRVYLQFHACDCIEFCVKDTSEEEETDEED